jgi:hypothetical protein
LGHSRGEVFLSPQERDRIRAQEYAVPPDLSQGARVPFRGRYRHLDEIIFGNMRKDPDYELTSILEYEPGMFEWGSPSAHDTVDVAVKSQHKVSVTVVTSTLPENPSHPEVIYESDLAEVTGQFDMVKMFHVGEDLTEGAYQSLRERLVERVTEGRYFLETERIHAPKSAAAHGFNPPHHIAFYQKIKGELVHIMDFPDGKYPKTVREAEGFQPGPERLYLIDEEETMEPVHRIS